MGDWCIFTPIDVITGCVAIFKLSLIITTLGFWIKKSRKHSCLLDWNFLMGDPLMRSRWYAIKLCQDLTGLDLQALADVFNVKHYSAISKAVGRLNALIIENKQVELQWEALRGCLMSEVKIWPLNEIFNKRLLWFVGCLFYFAFFALALAR